MRLYTRTGDDGTTGLFGGQRVRKDDARVEAYGCVDELNAAIGLALAELQRIKHEPSSPAALWAAECLGLLDPLQSRLFDIGADLATPASSPHSDKIARIGEAHIQEIENWIDIVDGGNQTMKSFVMPGGSEAASRLHLARTICRRAERAIVRLQAMDAINPAAIVYINRVSDLLFAIARRANRESGVNDVPWMPTRPARSS